jgi:murein DD-endopeptidase MepM/ murein hydrolase activator NlpD
LGLAREDLPILGGDEEPEEAEREEHPPSFDPGLTTGYLRRGSRDHDLPVELGAAPFDPGPGTGYDERRARREAKRRRREEDHRRQRLAKLEAEIERGQRAEREAREREERERRARDLAERAERERAERAERDRAERAERERRLATERDRERLERQRAELREKRRRALAQRERERQERERVERQRQMRESALRERRRRERPTARRPPRATRPTTRSPRARRRQAGLGWPTARAAVALAAVTAVAGVFGAAIGLPVPVLGEPGSPIAASLTGNSNSVVDSGTLPGPTKGPYFPVVTDDPDFGEADAKFGAERYGHTHLGQDVFVKPGTPLVAVREGVVVDGAGGKSFYAYGGGNSLVIYSPVDHRSYVYLHMLRSALVRAGETVQAGQPVGQVGCTGSCYGPHLHFEIRLGRVGYRVQRKAIDPLPLLQQWPAAPSQ